MRRGVVIADGAKGEGCVVTSLPITAIVVGLNEGHLLERCLDAISFCDELIYVDLGSTDSSIEIAESSNARVVMHPKVPIGEYALASAQQWAANDWILFIDPDEVIDDSLVGLILDRFPALLKQPKVGAVAAPWQFYFKKQPLYGTPWGGLRYKTFIAHRDRFQIAPVVHRGRFLRDGYDCENFDGGGQIDHYWSDSWPKLVSKHWRYLKLEGASRYLRGDRISLGGIIVSLPRTAAKTLKLLDSRDGYRGLLLSGLWLVYSFGALCSLWVYSLFRDRQRKSGG